MKRDQNEHPILTVLRGTGPIGAIGAIGFLAISLLLDRPWEKVLPILSGIVFGTLVITVILGLLASKERE